MDKNSIIGISLIALILGVWVYMTTPSAEELANQRRIRDSIALAESKTLQQNEIKNKIEDKTALPKVSDSTAVKNDSIILSEKQNYYKDFFIATKGEEKLYTLENEKFKITFTNKGGRIKQVELKEYHRYGDTSFLKLFDNDSTYYSLALDAYERSRIFHTDSFYFSVPTIEKNKIVFRLNTAKDNSSINFVYTLPNNDYTVKFDIELYGMNDIISSNIDELFFNWNCLMPSQEKHIVKEKEVATVYFKYTDDSPDYINPRKEEEKEINEMPIKWVCFKQQFFNSTIIADKEFMKDGSLIKLRTKDEDTNIVKATKAELGIPFSHQNSETFGMNFYFGPNHYPTLKKYEGWDLQGIIPTGWWIFKYINSGLVIPIFNWLKGTLNFGIILIILNIIIKIILFPIFYKNYMSGAKMRALKPEIDKLNEKYGPNGDPVKKQQDLMALYQKAKVNPMMGCLLLLIQFPILIALFNFVPAAIELRQEAFLWADDLSTYDSIWDFGKIPIIYSIYGDHVSLFALLMFLSTILYTWLNSEMLSPQQNQQVPGMKFMMYFMPLIFLAVMNNYSAGLSWYYFTANILTFGQTYLLKYLIKDEKIRAEIEANLKQPVKVSGFQKRLQDMMKQQQQMQQQKSKGKK
ncbi:MAG TPA: membrane protein insertase YidC [Bacteroidia bacterium]|nr:membrane protein insertase YidC [Bacteroidia bacterium]